MTLILPKSTSKANIVQGATHAQDSISDQCQIFCETKFDLQFIISFFAFFEFHKETSTENHIHSQKFVLYLHEGYSSGLKQLHTNLLKLAEREKNTQLHTALVTICYVCNKYHRKGANKKRMSINAVEKDAYKYRIAFCTNDIFCSKYLCQTHIPLLLYTYLSRNHRISAPDRSSTVHMGRTNKVWTCTRVYCGEF